MDEGLSHREVRHIFKDSQGLIWASTRNGLNRFDGHQFTWFTKEKNGLSSNDIRFVVEDATGWLWIFSVQQGSELGWDFVDLMNVKTMEVVSWNEREAPFLPKEIIDCIANSDKELFIGTENGELWKLGVKGEFIKIPIRGLENFTPKYISEKGMVWGVENRQEESNWVEIDPKGRLLKKFKHDAGTVFSPSGQDENGQIWYLCFNRNKTEVFYIDQNGKRIKYRPDLIKGGDIHEKINYADHHGLLIHPQNHSFWWSGSDFFAVKATRHAPIHSLQEKYPGLLYKYFFMFDNLGIGWVCSVEGIYRIKIEPILFKNLLSQSFDEATTDNRIECRGMLEAEDGSVFINSYAGTFLLSADGKIRKKDFLGVPDEFTYASMAMYQDASGDMWFGWRQPIRRNGQTGALTYYALPSGESDLNIWAMYQQPSGRMWFAGLNGDFAFLEPGQDTLQYFKNYNRFNELRDANILSFDSRRDGKVWLATNVGLYLFDPEQMKILKRYWTGGTGETHLPHDNIHHVHQDGESILWLATGGGGLVRWTVGGGRRTADGGRQTVEAVRRQFTKADGLSSDVLYAVYEDDFGNLWISSDYGIIQFNKETEQSRAFLPEDGLPHFEFNRISHHQTKEGKLYFGSLNGVTTFYPRDFQEIEEHKDPPLVLLDLQQFDAKENGLVNKMKDFAVQKKIVMRPGDRVVNLEFALLDFNAPERIRYAYQVEGVDEGWNYLKENHISLSGLPYGNFTLKVRGQAASGVFSSKELNIPIRVLKPFYLKFWFIAVANLFFLLFVAALFRFRTLQLRRQKDELEISVQRRTQTIRDQNKQLEQQAQELRHLDQVKSRFFANVSHELRTPLTLLLGPIGSVLNNGQLTGRNFTLLKKAKQSGRNLLNLINEILDLSKIEAGYMELQESPSFLYSFFKHSFALFESHAKLNDIQFLMDYDATESLQILLDVDKFKKVVNNLLSNAFKYTAKKGTVTLRLRELDNEILLSVVDTGQGIHPDDVPNIFDRFYQTNRPDSPAGGGTGIGLALVREYAQLFKGKTWVESKLGEGSTFNFQFPKKLVEGTADGKEGAEEPNLTNEILSPKPGLTTLVATAPSAAHAPLPTVLVVEDNPDLRDYLQTILEVKYNVQTAENGQVAWELLNGELKMENGELNDDSQLSIINYQLSIDLILSDLMMPIMDGYQLLEKLKSDDRFRHIPTVMLTARADLRDKLKALRIGVDDYLLKPFEEEELLARIENLLNNSRLRHAAQNETSESRPAKVTMTQADADWLAELEKLVQKGQKSKLLSVSWLAANSNLSERQFRRRLHKTSGLSPQQYIAEMRLQEARALLEVGKYATIAEVAYAIGFNDASAFSRKFRNHFGKSPSDYLPNV